MNWVLARLREPSTWRGLLWLLTAMGVSLRPDVWEQVAAIGMAMAGLIGVLSQEGPKQINVYLPPLDLQGRSAAPPDGARIRVDAPPNHRASPDLDERNSHLDWRGFNDR